MNREPIVRVNVKSQQFALQTLGLYRGEVDGNWTSECIKAQKEMARLHGGDGHNGQPLRSPARAPRHFVWSRLDNQEFLLFNDPTGKTTAEAYTKAFVEACAPAAFVGRPEPITDAGSLRAVAEQKSEELRQRQADDKDFKPAKAAAPDVDLSRSKKGQHKAQPQQQPAAQGQAQAQVAAEDAEKAPEQGVQGQEKGGKAEHSKK